MSIFMLLYAHGHENEFLTMYSTNRDGSGLMNHVNKRKNVTGIHKISV